MAERPAPSTRPVILNAPPGYLDQVPKDVQVEQQLGTGPYDFIQFFATRRAEVFAEGPQLRQALKPGGILWVSYPKGKTLPTDLNRDILRVVLEEVGLEAVSQVAIDDVWSALRAKVV